MARCGRESCGRWCPDLLAGHGIGALVDEPWFCSRACIEQMARERLATPPPEAVGLPGVPRVRLGALLTSLGACNADALAEALDAQRETRLRLGEQLRAMGVAGSDDVLRALAMQFGVRCLPSIDAMVVREAPSGLPAEAVRALGVAPISAVDGGRVRVACPAPLPRRAINALRQLTGWTPEVYLVSDEDWRALLDNYGADRPPDTLAAAMPDFVRTESVSDAAARIAAAAARARRTTVVEARWDDYAWVRVRGRGVLEDVCLARVTARDREEAPWLADITPR